jgi:hypothetical protein
LECIPLPEGRATRGLNSRGAALIFPNLQRPIRQPKQAPAS